MRHRTMSKRTRQGHSRIKQRTGGGTQREAKLNPKAHRRINRREVGLVTLESAWGWFEQAAT